MSINWPIVILCAVGISILLTVIVIPQILQVSLTKRLFDRPNERKIHSGVVPRLGGFAFLPVIILTLGIMLVIPALYSEHSSLGGTEEFLRFVPDLVVLFGAMIIMFLTGLYDDLIGLKYSVKFLAQLIAAIMLVEAGCYITGYEDLFGIGVTGAVMGKIITGFLIIYIVNSLNLIDGIDGLAAGLCVVALIFFGIALYVEQLYLLSLLSWIGAGSMAVFWVFNVFGSKRRHTKIFMGDIGSLSMGVFVSFLVVEIGKFPDSLSAWNVKPLVLAFSPLIIPMLDVVRVFCVRIFHGSSPFLPDKRHIHHLMLAGGIRMRMAMAILIVSQICLIAINVWLAEFMGINAILIINVVLYIIGLLAIPKSQKRN